MTDEPVSLYLLRPLRGICHTCKERIAQDETGVCNRCYEDAQAGIGEVVDLDERRDMKKWGG